MREKKGGGVGSSRCTDYGLRGFPRFKTGEGRGGAAMGGIRMVLINTIGAKRVGEVGEIVFLQFTKFSPGALVFKLSLSRASHSQAAEMK